VTFLLGRLMAHRTHLMTTLLVFSLASGVLGGVLFYMDSTSSTIMNDMIEHDPIHIELSFNQAFYDQHNLSVQSFLETVRSEHEVGRAELVTVIDVSIRYPLNQSYSRYAYLGVESSFFSTFSDLVFLSTNSLPLGSDGCYLEESFLAQTGLAVGDTIELWGVNDWIWNPIKRDFVLKGSFTSSGPWGSYRSGESDVPILRMITTNDLLWSQFSSMGVHIDGGLEYRFWLKTDSAYLGSLDPSQAAASVSQLLMKLEQKTVPYAEVTESPILSGITSYAAWASSLRSTAIAFSIPSIMTGFMLVQYGSELMADERRQEVGFLRVRGASGWQAFSWVLSLAMVTALVGSLGAIAMGLFATLLSGSVKEFVVIDLGALTGFGVLLTPSAFVFVFLFSFGVGFLVALPAAIRSLLVSPTDAHSRVDRDPQDKTAQSDNPAVGLLIVVVTGFLAFQLLATAGGSGFTGGGLVTVIARIAIFGAFVLSLTRLLSLRSGHSKSWAIQRIHSASLLVGTRVLGRRVGHDAKRESIGVLFIAMVFVSCVFSAVAATTESQHLRSLFSFEIGADVVATVHPGLRDFTLEDMSGIQAIDGVESAAAMLTYVTRVVYWNLGPFESRKLNRSITVYGVQPSEWAETAFLLPYFTKVRSPTENLQMINQNASLVLSSFRPISGYRLAGDSGYVPTYGSSIQLEFRNSLDDKYVNLTIIDVMSSDEGPDGTKYLPGFPNADDFLLVSIELLHQRLNTTAVSKAYVSLEPGADYAAVVDSLREAAPDSFLRIECSAQEFDSIMAMRAMQSVFGVYTLNVVFSLAYLTLGMTLLSIEKERRYRKDFAVLRSMGTPPKTILTSVLLDAAVSIAMAAVIGCLVGFVLSGLVLATPLLHAAGSMTLPWNRLLITLELPVSFLWQFVTASFLLPLIATYVVARRGLMSRVADELSSSE